MKFRLHSRSAFTLVEAVVAIGVVSMGVLASLSMLTFVQVQNDLEQERARAHQIVTEEIERVRFQLFTRVRSGSQVTIWDNGTVPTTDDTTGTIEVEIRDPETNTVLVAAPVPAVIVQVEVTLTWRPRGRLASKTYRESAMTYIVP